MNKLDTMGVAVTCALALSLGCGRSPNAAEERVKKRLWSCVQLAEKKIRGARAAFAKANDGFGQHRARLRELRRRKALCRSYARGTIPLPSFHVPLKAGPAEPKQKREWPAGPPPAVATLPPSPGQGGGLSSSLGGSSAKDAEDALAALQGIAPGAAGGLSKKGGTGAGGVGFGGWGGGKGGGGGGGALGLGGGKPGKASGRPRTFLGRLQVAGGLDAATVRRRVRRHLTAIMYCYTSRGLLANPSLQGRVKVSFTIGQTGRVRSAAVAGSTLGHAGTEACLVQAVRRIRFPQPNGPNPFVTAPFGFKP